MTPRPTPGRTRRCLLHRAVLTGLALAAVTLPGCGRTAPPVPDAQVRCDLGRANHQGVAGHDLAASTRLPDGRVLFVFGDTYLGSIRGDRRTLTGLLNSSGAVLPPGTDICSPRLRYLTDGTGRPRALLRPPRTKGTVFWPVDVAVWKGRIWMLYRWVQRVGDGPLEVKVRGTGLASASPADLDFHPARGLLVTGDATVPAALAPDGRHLRVLTCPADADGCATATVDVEAPRLEPARPGDEVIGLTSTEMTLTRLPVDGRVRWRTSGMGGLRCTLEIATALDPDDPWSEPEPVLRPEKQDDVLCYAGRVQEAFSTATDIVATWVDSGADPTDADLYWPHVREFRLSG